MDKDQLRQLISNTLENLGLDNDGAVELLMLTAATESKLGYYIRQVGGGPAQGIFQMEPATEKDIWDNYLTYKKELAAEINEYESMKNGDLMWNIAYQIIMARVHYLRVKDPLPSADDVAGLANYWKKHYNTEKGKGTVRKAIEAYQKYT